MDTLRRLHTNPERAARHGVVPDSYRLNPSFGLEFTFSSEWDRLLGITSLTLK